MPTIRVTIVDGQSEEEIRAFMDGVTKLAVDVLKAKEEGVIVHVEVLRPGHYMRGGATVAQRRAVDGRHGAPR
ncbi:MAG: tautomerase family protein [Candidatus Thermoplasmatota archaeon]